MSELIKKSSDRATVRWKLLTGASALALTTYVSSMNMARAEEANHSQVWIELGGQLSRLQNGQESYAPSFVVLTPSEFTSPVKSERPPLYGFEETGKVSFQPGNSDWTFSASIRYGRSNSNKHVRQQSYPGQYTAYSRFHRTTGTNSFHHTNFRKVDPVGGRFADTLAKESNDYAILDFQAGKDVGLGLFGNNTSSTLSLGVRIAQFHSKSRATLGENPDWHFSPRLSGFNTSYTTYYGSPFSFGRTNQQIYQPHHTFVGHFSASRSFNGLGPSISWRSSLPFAGNRQDGELGVDWGLNAALLFGRQKAKTSHETTAYYNAGYFQHYRSTVYRHGPFTNTRSHSVTVPNIGGSIGISWKLQNFNMSLGYRADFFFGAMDGGIDSRKTYDRDFYGPYATVSIGLGG